MAGSDDDDISHLGRPRRCLFCSYVIEGLADNRCPECGAKFQPHDLRTFTRKVPFIWWKFWLPGAVLGFAGGVLLLPLLGWFVGMDIAIVLVVPFPIGAIVGYGNRIRNKIVVVLEVLVVAGCLTTVAFIALSPRSIGEGLYAGLAYGLLILALLLPAGAGVLAGACLRNLLLRSDFSQADYLDPWAM